uniref:Protein kinase domain-containing protein n=1 Tax=Macrostomum lignano TaxID=282301 RepID=A0A1I8GSV6_9PLAT
RVALVGPTRGPKSETPGATGGGLTGPIRAGYCCGCGAAVLPLQSAKAVGCQDRTGPTSMVKNYSIGEQIGRGEYASVHAVTIKDRSPTATCVKLIKLPTNSEQVLDKKELTELVEKHKPLRELKHRNLIQIEDLHVIQQDYSIAVFMERFQGKTLEYLLKTKGAITQEDKIRHYSKQICEALKYLHHDLKDPVIHRNICSKTVMIDDNDLVKLIDFGISIQLIDAVSHQVTQCPRGHPNYMAPELFLEESRSEVQSLYSRGSDIWAFGCVVYEMTTGAKPLGDCRNMLAIVNKIKYHGAPNLPEASSEQLRDFYKGCMRMNRKERMSAADLLRHEFLSPVYDKHWDNVRLLSRGGFAEIHEALTDKGIRCAVKTLKLPLQLGDQRDKVQRETDRAIESEMNLCRLRHDNIVKIFDILQPEIATVVVFMELLDGKTLELVIDGKPLDEGMIRLFASQICSALSYMHNQPEKSAVIHRDLNCSNIVILDDNKVKLIDFGLSHRLGTSISHSTASSVKGTLNFMAPELLGDDEKIVYSTASDVWAFGCAVYQMATGERPFEKIKNLNRLIHTLKEQGAQLLPDSCSSLLKDFYASCVMRQRLERASAITLMKHEFLTFKASEYEDEDRYESSASQKGMCAIIDMLPSGSDSKLSAKISKSFEKFDFIVKSLPDATCQTAWSFIGDIANSQELADSKCFVCFVIASGSNGHLYSADNDESIEIRDLLARFRSSQCPSLKDKPKLFFIQAAQPASAAAGLDESTTRIRDDDFLVCINDADLDSSFVGTLCTVLEEDKFSDLDIEGVVDEVNNRLKLEPLVKAKNRALKSMSEAVSTLTKKFYLKPEPVKPDPRAESPEKWDDEQLKRLIEEEASQCANPDFTSQKYGPLGQTLLSIAADKDSSELVKLALQTAATFPSIHSDLDVMGRTALSCAAAKGSDAVLAAFEQAFIDAADVQKSVVNEANYMRQTPIIVAAKQNRTNVLEKLVRMGADINQKDIVEATALIYAAKFGFVDAVRKLLELGADAALADRSDQTPLIWAARCGHTDVINALSEKFNSLEPWNHRSTRLRNLTALEWAKLCGHDATADRIQQLRRTPLPTHNQGVAVAVMTVPVVKRQELPPEVATEAEEAAAEPLVEEVVLMKLVEGVPVAEVPVAEVVVAEVVVAEVAVAEVVVAGLFTI